MSGLNSCKHCPIVTVMCRNCMLSGRDMYPVHVHACMHACVAHVCFVYPHAPNVVPNKNLSKFLVALSMDIPSV